MAIPQNAVLMIAKLPFSRLADFVSPSPSGRGQG